MKREKRRSEDQWRNRGSQEPGTTTEQGPRRKGDREKKVVVERERARGWGERKAKYYLL